MAKKVTVELTLVDVQILRRLIVEEFKRVNPSGAYQHEVDYPNRLKRMRPVARKIWEARQEF